MFAGEYLTYYSPIHQYDADASWNGSNVSFEASSSGSDTYDATLIDNGDGSPVDVLRIYVDATYDEYYAEAKELSKFPYLDQGYYAEQVVSFLKMRSYTGASSCDERQLVDYLSSTMSDAGGKGLMVTSYALPSSIYDGTSDCLLVEWVQAGGTLYWVGSEIGRFVIGEDGLQEVRGNQTLFLGSECIYTGGRLVAPNVIENGFTEHLTLKNSDVMNGVRVADVPGALGIGYTVDGYASISLVPSGNGSICIFAGPFDINQLDDIGQVIATGLNPSSKVVDHSGGKVVRETVTGSLNLPSEHGNLLLYIYVGGTYPKFGEAFLG